jgi:charged multivesicular body protein 1
MPFFGSGNSSRNLQNQLFNLKFTSKTLARQSQKAEKAAKAQKTKCKKAMEKGNMEVAKIHAENAIREKNQALNLLRMSARIDAVAQRVNTAVNMNTLTGSMASVVRSMDTAMQSMDAVKISAVMDQFERQFEDLDISLNFMDGAMQQQGALTTPASEVETLMGQVNHQSHTLAHTDTCHHDDIQLTNNPPIYLYIKPRTLI